MESQNCPICGVPVIVNLRYPNYVCDTCFVKAVASNGRKLKFYNTSIGGGYLAVYADTEEVYPDHICYINQTKCWADEARFGGIVIQKLPSET
jgi:hypothetical protein